jgi:UDP-N-acetylmuramyl pentapeptide synthase
MTKPFPLSGRKGGETENPERVELIVGNPGEEPENQPAPVAVLPAVYELGQVSEAVNHLREEVRDCQGTTAANVAGLADLAEVVRNLKETLDRVVQEEEQLEEEIHEEKRASWWELGLGHH